MKIQIFLDEVKIDEGKYDHLFIEGFLPSNQDEKDILLKGLNKVKETLNEKFTFGKR